MCQNHIKNKSKPTLNIAENSKHQKCGTQFNTVHPTTCPVRDTSCNNCGCQEHFAKYCESSARNQINVIEANPNVPEQQSQRDNPQGIFEIEAHLDDF